MGAKHEGYTFNDFRTVDFHPILPSPVWIEDCGKPARSLSPIQVWGIRELSGRQKQKSTYCTDFKRHLPQVLEISVSPVTVWRILHEEGIKPFHLQRVQCLKDDDYPHRLHFVRWILQSIANNPQFLSLVLFTDEASFTKEGIFNTHNDHVWGESNPYLTALRKYQERFSVNVWIGIFGDRLFAPYLLPDCFTGEKYLVFLQRVLPSLLRPVPSVAQQMWYMHDGAPAHITADVRHFLDVTCPQRWIGRGGPVTCSENRCCSR